MTAETRPHVNVWFEIPATDFDRACRFYEGLFDVALHRDAMVGGHLGVFPYEKPNISGCVMQAPHLQPGGAGVVIYLNADGVGLDEAMRRVPLLGGKLATPRIELPPGMGAFFHLIDTEGNRVGVHQEA